MTYTYKPRTSAEIKADIAELKIALALALDDDRADMESDLASLHEELDEALAAEPVPDKHAPGGLNLPLVEKAFGTKAMNDFFEVAERAFGATPEEFAEWLEKDR